MNRVEVRELSVSFGTRSVVDRVSFGIDHVLSSARTDSSAPGASCVLTTHPVYWLPASLVRG